MPGVRFAREMKPKLEIIKQLSPILQSIDTTKKKVLLAKTNYFNKDSKDVKSADVSILEQQLENLNKEFELLKTTFRAGLKDRPIRLRLSAPVTITTTVTTGVTKTVVVGAGGNSLLNPTRCTEWSTVIALFDEYKCLGGEVVFVYINPVLYATSVTSDSLPVMAYDVGDATTATSSIALTQQSQHKILPVVALFSAVNLQTSSTPNVKHSFRWHTPKGTVVPSVLTAFPGTEWIPCEAAGAAGSLLFYHIGTLITAIDSGSGVCYFDLEFRCRA
jgi:hypothetical protein